MTIAYNGLKDSIAHCIPCYIALSVHNGPVRNEITQYYAHPVSCAINYITKLFAAMGDTFVVPNPSLALAEALVLALS